MNPDLLLSGAAREFAATPESPSPFSKIRFAVVRVDETTRREPALLVVALRATRGEAEAVAQACRDDHARIRREHFDVTASIGAQRGPDVATDADKLAEAAARLRAIQPSRFDPKAPLERTAYVVVEEPA